MKEKRYFYFNVVTAGKIDRTDNYQARTDNGFEGKAGNLIGRNWCYIIPKIKRTRIGLCIHIFIRAIEIGTATWKK